MTAYHLPEAAVFRLNLLSGPLPTKWELAAEAIALKIRWFGLALRYAYANFGANTRDPLPLNAILSLGFGFTALATYAYWRGRELLCSHPLLISCIEAPFVSLL